MNAMDDATREQQAVLHGLIAMMHEKGWEKARAHMEIKIDEVQLWLTVDDERASAFKNLGGAWGHRLIYGKTFNAVLAEARQAIAEMAEHVTNQIAPWFALSSEGEKLENAASGAHHHVDL